MWFLSAPHTEQAHTFPGDLTGNAGSDSEVLEQDLRFCISKQAPMGHRELVVQGIIVVSTLGFKKGVRVSGLFT